MDGYAQVRSTPTSSYYPLAYQKWVHPVGWIILLSSLVIKKLILHYWKDTRAPSIYHWKINMLHIIEKEQYAATEGKQAQQFNQIWSDIINVLQR